MASKFKHQKQFTFLRSIHQWSLSNEEKKIKRLLLSRNFSKYLYMRIKKLKRKEVVLKDFNEPSNILVWHCFLDKLWEAT